MARRGPKRRIEPVRSRSLRSVGGGRFGHTGVETTIAAFPTNPVPLNDRYLLHSLAGNESACGSTD